MIIVCKLANQIKFFHHREHSGGTGLVPHQRSGVHRDQNGTSWKQSMWTELVLIKILYSILEAQRVVPQSYTEKRGVTQRKTNKSAALPTFHVRDGSSAV
ncbi:MAG: hypothetical protein DWQ02_16320 [Bacteroidetes bacterium]|nr:MAG: hypothetical protein DWQ02_16320 [Bacteroidota bacterium]